MQLGFYRSTAGSMKAPFHFRGPFMAKIWLLFALGIIGLQMVFVVNLLVKRNTSLNQLEPEVAVGFESASEESAKTSDLGSTAANHQKEHYRENLVDTDDQPPLVAPDKTFQEKPAVNEAEHGGLAQTTIRQDHATASSLEDNNPMFNFLRNTVDQVFNGPGGAAASSSSDRSNPLSQMNKLMPLMALLPALTGGQASSAMGAVDWAKFMPMLERVERFAKYCAVTFQQTIQETKKSYPQKAKESSFISAVAMKGFFRIFANEDYQEEFLELADDAFGLLESLGMTDHVIDLVSGRMYEKILSSPDGVPADGNFLSGGAAGLAAIFLKSDKEKKALGQTTSTTTAGPKKGANEDEDEEDIEEDEEGKAALVSNEHFETIMEVYDYMFREEENTNASAAKLELGGRMFLQTWYGAMRRFAIEKGKIKAKSLTDASFEKYLESVNVPFSNILDFSYPIKNENFCKYNPAPLLIMVTSKNQNTALRNAIRQTWGSTSSIFNVVFLLTDRDEDRLMVRKESNKYGDVVSVDVPQTYEYVTRKALVALDWPVTYCSSANYIFKTTDHFYLNVSILQSEIQLQNGAQLIGNLVVDDLVQRVPLKLDHLFYDEYPFDKFKPYIKGFGFLMGMNFARRAIGIAKDFPLLRTEDFAITGILSAQLKVTPVGFKKHSVTGLVDASWEDSQKMTKLICEKKDHVAFGGKLTAPQTLFIHATLNSCSLALV